MDPIGIGPQSSVSADELDGLVRRTADAAVAYISGDIQTYLKLIKHSSDYTLMGPTGGDVVRGFDTSPEALKATSDFFHGGEASLEVAQSYVSGDLAVLVVIERQHGEVGGFPDQDWSLRVTLVFRRQGPEWLLVHRHADPLVHSIPFDQLAAISRGE